VLRANVHHDNTPSLSLFRRAGYRLATDGEWQWLEKSPSQE
jgi:L-amino acid N-acyltransferase YncA